MAKVKWAAKQAVIQFTDASNITLDSTTATYKDQFATASATSVEAYIKDVTITPPELTVETVHTLGEDSAGFQNSYMEEKPAGMAKLEGTLVMQGDEIFESFFNGTTNVTGYTDYHYNPSKRKSMSVLVSFDDGVDEVNIVLNDVYIKLGERKPTSVDGHWEQSIEITCRPNDYREQFKD